MNTAQIETFFAETTKAFHFLEAQYGYQQLEREIKHPEEPRDISAQVKYVSARIGVGIGWGVANGFIGVSFVELLQPHVFPSSTSSFPFRDRPNTAKAIGLYNLADMLNHIDDPDFLLKGIDDFRTHNRRMKTIETSMPEVLAGLAHATQTYAISILQGDTSIFSQVMKFTLAKQKKLYPGMLLPLYIVDDPS